MRRYPSTLEFNMADILVILAHPKEDSFCGTLTQAYSQAALDAGASVDVLNLASLRFDPILHNGYATIQPLEPDLLDAQRKIEQAKHVVWVYPMWWVSVPALLKGFIDRTFLPGWAFRYGEGKMPVKLLKGRTARVVMTMDSPNWWYWLGYRRAATHAFERGVLKFSGFERIKRSIIYHTQALSSAQRQAHMDKVASAARADVRKLSRIKAPNALLETSTAAIEAKS